MKLNSSRNFVNFLTIFSTLFHLRKDETDATISYPSKIIYPWNLNNNLVLVFVNSFQISNPISSSYNNDRYDEMGETSNSERTILEITTQISQISRTTFRTCLHAMFPPAVVVYYGNFFP